MLWRSSLRYDCTAVLAPRSRGRTHCAHFVRCVQTTAASQTTKRAARADLGPALLVATEFARAGWRLPLGNRWGFSSEGQERCSKGACGQAGARLWSAEWRRARGLARSASRDPTCRRTHFAHFVRCVQTGGDKSDHDSRCARGHEHAASRRSRGALQPARTRPCCNVVAGPTKCLSAPRAVAAAGRGRGGLRVRRGGPRSCWRAVRARRATRSAAGPGAPAGRLATR